MATPVIMPRQGQSVESCVLVEWRVAAGDRVSVGTPLANIETDKAVFEVESPAAGIVLDLFFNPGEDIPVLTNIAAIGTPGEDATPLRPSGRAADGSVPSGTAATASTPAAAMGPTAVSPVRGGQASTGVSPRARRAAERAGLDAAALAGSGPGGRVIERDVRAATLGGPHLSAAALAKAHAGGLMAPARGAGPGGLVLAGDLVATAAAPVQPPAPAGESTEVPLTGVRKIIAERMRQSLAGTAQLTLSMSFDATAILEVRRQVKDDGARRGLPNITLNDMIVHAAARTLTQHPLLNAHFRGDRILRFSKVNVGVATDTPRGLLVPVLRDAASLPLAELSRTLKQILDAAQAGTISPDLLKGGTFTITNMGMLGIESFTPILNAPEVAILGVGGLMLRPVERDGAVQHVQSITLSLTIDHQAVDGAPGARFLKALVMMLESFEIAG